MIGTLFTRLSSKLQECLAFMLGDMDYSDQVSGSSNADEERREAISYDTSLPTQHSYLGNDLEELSGRTVLEDNLTVTLPLLVLPNIVLMPGQKLPLQLLRPATVSMMQHIIEKDRTFGLINQRQTDGSMVRNISIIGTTAEVRSYKEDPDENTGFTVLRVLAEGSQRFRVEKSWRQADGILMGKVRILPEVSVGDYLEGARCPSLQRFAVLPPNFQSLDAPKDHSLDRCQLKPCCRKYNRRACADFTWWPAWVYEQYDTDILINEIKLEIRSWLNSRLMLDTSPTDPTKFSYWVAINIPIDDSRKLNLLSSNSAVQRLRSELSILKKHIVLRCKECTELIAERKDIFSMSLEGPQGMYVNPSGYVHETITVYRSTGLSLIGRPLTEHSWFPGYAWIIAQCRQCSSHMGWKFVATDKNLKPEKFWGLCRSSVLSGTQSDDTDGSWNFEDTFIS